jgi:hypothetical protein
MKEPSEAANEFRGNPEREHQAQNKSAAEVDHAHGVQAGEYERECQKDQSDIGQG